jgi:peptidoglycan/LPS O-acetylase OafA/YrhL
MAMFAAGGLAYFVGRKINSISPQTMRWSGMIAIVGFVFLTIFAKVVSPSLPDRNDYYSASLMLQNPQVVMFTILTVAPLFYATRHSRLDQLLGELSYPMYVTHILIVELILRSVPSVLLEGNALYVAAVVATSLMLLFAVTMPLDKFRKRFGARDVMADIAGLSGTLQRSDTGSLPLAGSRDTAQL